MCFPRKHCFGYPHDAHAAGANAWICFDAMVCLWRPSPSLSVRDWLLDLVTEENEIRKSEWRRRLELKLVQHTCTCRSLLVFLGKAVGNRWKERIRDVVLSCIGTFKSRLRWRKVMPLTEILTSVRFMTLSSLISVTTKRLAKMWSVPGTRYSCVNEYQYRYRYRIDFLYLSILLL